jgi:hypothetical protein
MDAAIVHYYDRVPRGKGLHATQESLDEFHETSRVESTLEDVTMDHSIG